VCDFERHTTRKDDVNKAVRQMLKGREFETEIQS
jgi:hypothetical protein